MPQMPTATGNRLGSKTERGMPRVFGIRMPPHRPCRALKRMTASMLPDRPMATEVTTQPPMPAR
jgi:hypothetical protein